MPLLKSKSTGQTFESGFDPGKLSRSTTRVMEENAERWKQLESLKSEMAALVEQLNDKRGQERAGKITMPAVAIAEQATDAKRHAIHQLAAEISQSVSGCEDPEVTGPADWLKRRLIDTRRQRSALWPEFVSASQNLTGHETEHAKLQGELRTASGGSRDSAEHTLKHVLRDMERAQKLFDDLNNDVIELSMKYTTLELEQARIRLLVAGCGDYTTEKSAMQICCAATGSRQASILDLFGVARITVWRDVIVDIPQSWMPYVASKLGGEFVEV